MSGGNPFDLHTFDLSYYERRVDPLPPAVLDGLVASLREAIGVIDGAELTDLPTPEPRKTGDER